MNTRALRRVGVLAAVASTSALVLAGCAGGGENAANTGDGEKVTLTIATFNNFGYTDEFLQKYEDENPNVTIVHNKAAESGDARKNFFQKLGKGGLADIEAVEVDWLSEAMQYSDLLAPVPDDLKGRWLDWKEQAATDADGNLIGYGTDIGPQAICYRADLFEAAGLPSEPAEVEALFDGDWNTYFDVADQYREASGKAMIDSANSVLQGIVNQIEYTYDEPDGTVIATSNPEIADAYKSVTERAVPNSAYSAQWGDDWIASFQGDDFATVLCPGWMQGIIAGYAPDQANWKIANTFPNGGGNWGGSYLTVPANGANVEEAQKLADWLSAPEQQVEAFVNVGAFPSQVDAYENADLTGYVNDYFGGAKTGEIGADRAEAVTVLPFKSADYFKYHDALQNAVNRVFDGSESETAAWDTWVAEVEAF
ncbi:ABC transporter substrate-binding protein [Microbacterium sp. EYE_5]|uniref:ABC transporter substrate-binding protein n=1 Tax=unclassified Microbacterium TaxID=2609290 RepID=UPI002006247B|nr:MULTISPECIES: ABC transporter substrate-binding protein [unclassified Microbacterium]MCK6079678.1 ABC transporter substrate-binding protein [Microbacterium sp. EYE_382]MCK6084949.1 ABC transporter substrate-binding protein [Microbacterium sp. EYE_384]MCK6122825.1 ABC transporter substrate-binding protein [Microbacterium sp. EYE_80]MCK6125712.1 ABC transporter substrate-binding protein [Microbacterium sp. EYE_79]MCK6140633.1 ABC transporter substrate-binding protein [Microbacterium sp. EYE_3